MFPNCRRKYRRASLRLSRPASVPWTLAAMITASPALAQQPADNNSTQVPADPAPAETFGLAAPAVVGPPKPAPLPPSQRYGVDIRLAPEVRLGPVNLASLLEEDAARAQVDKVLRCGVARPMLVNLEQGQWHDIAGVGRLWTVDIVAEGALGIRLHFADVDLPPGAEIVVYAASHPERLAGPYRRRGIFGNGQFWTPTRFDERLRVEYFVPAEAPEDPETPPFVIDELQHIYRDPIRGNGGNPPGGGRPDKEGDAAEKDPPGGPRDGGCSSGGCTNSTTLYPSALFSTTSSDWTTFTTCAYAGEHSRFSVEQGSTYEWSACTGDGPASCSWDSQFMLRDTSGNNICYNDDWCGLQSKIRWMATFTGEVHLARMQYNCVTNTTCATLVWRRAPCRIDTTCYPSWSNVARAVARIQFISGGSFVCTGQLLNNLISDFTPYFMTAGHCINTQAEAQSAELYWVYQTPTCDGTPPPLGSVPRSDVCTLLATGTPSDYSLLMVEGELPGGLFWSGWTSGAISDGTAATGIHHPAGSWKRISFGTKTSTTSTHHWIGWSDGGTEGGSSGSGIFTVSGPSFFGQLSGNVPDCYFEDNYGAFSVTYPNISGFMAAGSDDGLEDNDTCSTARTMGPGTSPNLIVKSTDEDWYRINVPSGGTLDVDVLFTDAFGDIDIRLFDACSGSVVASSTSTTDNESISYVNPGGTADFYLRVYLYSDTRNDYDMTIGVADHCYNCPTYDYSISPASSYSTHSDSFQAGGCRWYRAYLTRYHQYRFTVCEDGGSHVGDSVFTLYDQSCTEVAFNDDHSGCSLGSQLDYVPTMSGYHYLKISEYLDNGPLTYTLAYRYIPGPCTSVPGFDYTITPTTSYQTHPSYIYRGGCRQYRVSMTAGRPYRFTFCEGGGTADYDTYLILRNSGGTQVASNDDYCGLQSQLTYDCTSSGTYFLEVNSCCTGGSGGTYTLAYRRGECLIDGDCPPDGNVCTDDVCSGSGVNRTCTYPNNSAPCNDGVFCNGSDTCSGGTCSQHAGDPCAGGPECVDSCNEAAGNCYDPAGTACTDDGNVCTDNECDGAGNCVAYNNSDPCDDGLFCNGADTCSGGNCSLHAGDPCGPNEWCYEGGNACIVYGDGDFDYDLDVDLIDTAEFQRCFGQYAGPACYPGNMTGGGVIDLDDAALFVAGLTGP